MLLFFFELLQNTTETFSYVSAQKEQVFPVHSSRAKNETLNTVILLDADDGEKRRKEEEENERNELLREGSGN